MGLSVDSIQLAMKVISAKQVTLDWSDFSKVGRYGSHIFSTNGRKRTHRSTGVHVSEILKYIVKELNMLKSIDQDDLDEAPLRMFLGMGWEYIIVSLIDGLVWQPGELIRDGIAGSPDGRRMIRVGPLMRQCITEMKFTKKSSRNFDITELKHRWWIWQMMSYLAMEASKQDLMYGEFHICFARGDYSQFLQPEEYHQYLIEFDRVELEKHWAMVLKYKEHVHA